MAGVGAIAVSGNALDALGRRPTLLISAMLLIAGSTIVAASNVFWLLLLGRAFQGFGSGTSWVACSVYVTEIAPAKYRGALVSLADIAINFGILFGYAMDYAVHEFALHRNFTNSTPAEEVLQRANLHWRTSMALSVLMPLIYCAVYAWIPESPRFLVTKEKDAEALRVIERLSVEGDPSPDAALAAIKE